MKTKNFVKTFLSVHMGPRLNILSQKNGQKSCDVCPFKLVALPSLLKDKYYIICFCTVPFLVSNQCEKVVFYAGFWTEIEPVLQKREDEDLLEDCNFNLHVFL